MLSEACQVQEANTNVIIVRPNAYVFQPGIAMCVYVRLAIY